MAEGVARLRELLFEREQREIGRIARQVDDVFDRAGTRERLQTSVAEVLDGALREAETSRHKELAAAVAPLVVQTVRTEIRNSTEDIVETLHPHMGRMIATYVANAFRDLMAKVNRRLESGLSARRWRLRLKSLATGRPESELLLAELDRFRVDELFLIRRGSGELIDQWQAVGVGEIAGKPVEAASVPVLRSNRDAMVSGFLAAINEFAREAFNADDTSLRSLDIQKHRIYLRTSPSYLLAAKCSGPATAEVESGLDAELLTILEQERETLAPRANGLRPQELTGILPRLAACLEQRFAASEAGAETGGTALAWRALAVIAALVIGWLAWSTWLGWRTDVVRSRVTEVLDGSPVFRSYPMRIEVERGGGAVRLAGIAPTAGDKAKLLAAVRAAIGSSRLEEQIAVLPEVAMPAEIDVASLRREVLSRAEALAVADGARQRLARAGSRLAAVLAEAQGIERSLPTQAARADLQRQRRDVEAMVRELDLLRAGLGRIETLNEPREQVAALGALAARLRGTAVGIARLHGGKPAADALAERTRAPEATREGVRERADELVILAEALAAELAALERSALRQEIAGLTARLDAQPAPLPPGPPLVRSPRAELEAWARAHAVFFSQDTTYRDEATASRLLKELVALASRTKAMIRVVGYTDEAGSNRNNAQLASARADKVRKELVALGLAQAQVIALGRASGPYLSPVTGPNSTNRRVEFEIGFDGEAPAPDGG